MIKKIEPFYVYTVFTVLLPSLGEAALVNPIDGYTVRGNGTYACCIVGGDSVSPLGFLSIKPDTEDRVVLMFDLQGQALSSETIYLNFYMHGMDAPNYTTIHLDYFYADTIRSSLFFNSVGNEITTFSDYGTGGGYASMNMSLDVTTVFNDFIINGSGYLGFILHGDSDLDPTTDARYTMDLSGSIALSSNTLTAYEPPPPYQPPLPPPPVPVPAAIWLFGTGLIGLAGFARRKKA